MNWRNQRFLPAMQESQVRSLGWEDLLEKGMATHSSIMAWRSPMDIEAGQATVPWAGKESDTTERLHSSSSSSSMFYLGPSQVALVVKNMPASAKDLRVGKMPWRRAWQPTLVFLPGESQRPRMLPDYGP